LGESFNDDEKMDFAGARDCAGSGIGLLVAKWQGRLQLGEVCRSGRAGELGLVVGRGWNHPGSLWPARAALGVDDERRL